MESEKEREKEVERKKHIEHYLKIMEESGVAPRTPPDFERTTADLLVECLEPVSYTHLTLPTKA